MLVPFQKLLQAVLEVQHNISDDHQLSLENISSTMNVLKFLEFGVIRAEQALTNAEYFSSPTYSLSPSRRWKKSAMPKRFRDFFSVSRPSFTYKLKDDEGPRAARLLHTHTHTALLLLKMQSDPCASLIFCC